MIDETALPKHKLDPQTEACRRLWMAVFHDAVTHYSPYQSWFKSPSEQPGSFIWCCELFNLNPKKVIKALNDKWKIQQRSRSSITKHNATTPARSAKAPQSRDSLLTESEKTPRFKYTRLSSTRRRTIG